MCSHPFRPAAGAALRFTLSIHTVMVRPAPAPRLIALLVALGALAACGRSEAAAGSASGATAASTPATATATASAPASPVQSLAAANGTGLPGDTLADSLLIQRADKGRLMGRSDAMWVVMISDFQCPYCKQWHDESMASLKRDYIDTGKIRLAYLHLPLSIHRYARVQAEASMCAAAQGKFWEYSERLFRDQKTFQSLESPTAHLSGLAREVKLDLPSYGRCMQSEAIRMLVENDLRQASQAKVQSTPSFLVGEFLVQGALPYKDFRRAIDTALTIASARARAGTSR